MTGFALYRLPHAETCTLIEGETQELLSCVELNGLSGFVIAPFAPSADIPIVLIRPDRTTEHPVCKVERDLLDIPDRGYGMTEHLIARSAALHKNPRLDYGIDFANYHSHLLTGEFRKIVLARCSVEPSDGRTSPLELFRQACDNYPRLFISLVFSPQSGLWLTATPEILLESDGNRWRTIALAGTQALTGEQLKMDIPPITWSVKNIQEQRFVATYITECIERFTNDFTEEGPCTVRAANLVHLRSDFTFSLSDNKHIGDVLAMLHPTPAVCGLPKRETFQFITHNEHTPRRYYSGFMGILSPETETHLYVSLRCMQIAGGNYFLYAGGGLLKGSEEEQEWLETEAKLETMRRCIAQKKM